MPYLIVAIVDARRVSPKGVGEGLISGFAPLPHYPDYKLSGEYSGTWILLLGPTINHAWHAWPNKRVPVERLEHATCSGCMIMKIEKCQTAKESSLYNCIVCGQLCETTSPCILLGREGGQYQQRGC